MKKFVGFQIQSGDILNKDTGEVTKWSNTFIRTVSDEGLLVGEFGLKIGEAKVKTEFIARSLGINNFDYSPNAINAVISELNKHHKGLLTKEYLSDEEILRNQGTIPEFADYSKDGQKGFRKAQRRNRK